MIAAVPTRARAAGLAAVILIAGIILLTLAQGELGVGPAQLLAIVRGEGDLRTAFVLEHLRGPRVAVAAGAGLALGLAGALFQTVTRNPLGSPDVIGLGAGAGAGVALATMWAPGAVPTRIGAVAGAGAAILLVHASTGRGFASPARLIVAGIGVAAMALALTQYVVAVQLRDAGAQLAGYLVGTLNARGADDVLTIAATLVICVPLAAALRHALVVMDMGDAMAEALGVGAVRTRTAAILLSVLLAAGAAAVAGPIAFVALAAPHVARRLARTPGPHLTLSALIGAVILLASDLVVQAVPPLEDLPVGVITTGVGGIYLGVLLVGEWRKAGR